VTTSTHPAHRIPTRRLRLSAALMALAGLAVGVAAEGDGAVAPAPAPAPTPAPPAAAPVGAEAALREYAKEADIHRQGREVAGDYHFQMGQKAVQDNRLDDAIRHLTTAVDYMPDKKEYRDSLATAQALSGQSRDARSVYINQIADQHAVEQQRLWAEAQERLEQGRAALEGGDFHEAERSFQLAHIRLESLPYADERKEPEQRRVEGLLAETRQRRARAELQQATQRNQTAEERQRELRDASLKIERDRISAMYGRAQKARDRRDFDEAILLCEQILKINRAEERAHDLLTKCRRERHVYLRQVTADRWDEEHKLVSEQIRTAMLPQLELLTYSHDWHELDARRTAPKHGLTQAENEPWRQQIAAQLDQEITLDFQDTDLVEVIAFLQHITSVNFVIDPAVVAGGTVPPVTLKVESMKLRYVLDYVMRLTSLNYAMRDQAIYVSDNKGLRGDVYMKLYDIRDLLQGMTQFPGPDLEIPEPGGTGSRLLAPIADQAPPEVTQFTDIIQRVVAPASWAEDSGASIGDYQGSMVITQSADVHKQVEELIRQLRNQRGTQIHVKVKFLTVENSLLEEIGVNWNNYNLLNGVPPNTNVVAGTTPQSGIGAYNRNGNATVAGTLTNQLIPYQTANSLPAPVAGEGLSVTSQQFHLVNGLYASAVLQAVEKDRRGNVVFEPDLTLFNGQQAHLVHINQQSYIADYDVVQGQYDPVVSILSYGTVLDVQAVASADKKYITLTLRPTNSQVQLWRRFGPPIDTGSDATNPFPGGIVVDPTTGDPQDGAGSDQTSGIAGGNPLLIPQVSYQSVRTSVTIPDGGSLMIAGMTNGESARSHAGVPFLSHIPFLGRLFSRNGRQETEKKTLVMVSADVILFDEIEKSL
jgi:general secretion pathway protein D